MKIPKAIYNLNLNAKISNLKQYFTKKEKVLDFGAGDLSLDRALLKINPRLSITSVDVVDFGKRYTGIKFFQYKGNKLPFGDNAFDTVISYHVFHHCENPVLSIKECIRVAKKRIIIVEPVYRYKLETLGMTFMDCMYNVWKDKKINMSYNFLNFQTLKHTFDQSNVKLTAVKEIDHFPHWIPIGRTYLYILTK